MYRTTRLATVMGLLLALSLPALGRAQEPPGGCAGAGRQPGEAGPTIAFASGLDPGGDTGEPAGPGELVGCGFRPGERVRLEAAIAIGGGDPAALEPLDVRADAEGGFAASLPVRLTPEDYGAGYRIEVEARGSEGSQSQTGMAAIAGGPAPQLPPAGGGAIAGEQPATALAAVALAIAAAGAYHLSRVARIRRS